MLGFKLIPVCKRGPVDNLLSLQIMTRFVFTHFKQYFFNTWHIIKCELIVEAWWSCDDWGSGISHMTPTKLKPFKIRILTHIGLIIYDLSICKTCFKYINKGGHLALVYSVVVPLWSFIQYYCRTHTYIERKLSQVKLNTNEMSFCDGNDSREITLKITNSFYVMEIIR